MVTVCVPVAVVVVVRVEAETTPIHEHADKYCSRLHTEDA